MGACPKCGKKQVRRRPDRRRICPRCGCLRSGMFLERAGAPIKKESSDAVVSDLVERAWPMVEAGIDGIHAQDG